MEMYQKMKNAKKEMVNKNRILIRENKESYEKTFNVSSEDISRSLGIYEELIEVMELTNSSNTEYLELLKTYCFGGKDGIKKMIENGDIISEEEEKE